MTQPRNYQTEAVIIKKTRLREADRILTLYTPQLGRIQGVAKGVRRPRSKLAGHLELLTHSQVSLARGRNLDTITGSQTINAFRPLKEDLWLMSCGLYVTELVNQFTADHVANPNLFQLLVDTLHHLSKQETNRDLALRYFELHLLHEVGYRPQLQQCVSCHSTLEPVVNHFSPSSGGVLCPDCTPSQSTSFPISVNALKVLRFLQGNGFATVNRLSIGQPLASELETTARVYIRYLLERDMKSIDWLDDVRREMAL